MKLNIEMSSVDGCGATACAYNVDEACHAKAITIGEGAHPACDTYVDLGRHVHADSNPAGVGACRVETCRFNEDLECGAGAIELQRHSLHADCITFERRESGVGSGKTEPVLR